MAVGAGVMNVLETVHAVNAGSANPETEQAAAQARKSDARTVDELNSGETLMAAVVASHIHGHSNMSDDHCFIVPSVSALMSVMVMMMAIIGDVAWLDILLDISRSYCGLRCGLGHIVSNWEGLCHLGLRWHVSLWLAVSHIGLSIGLAGHSIWILRVSIGGRRHIRVILGLRLVCATWGCLIVRWLHSRKWGLHARRVHHIRLSSTWRGGVTLVILRKLLVVVLWIHKLLMSFFS